MPLSLLPCPVPHSDCYPSRTLIVARPAFSPAQFSSDEHLSQLPGGGADASPATIREESEGSEQMEEGQVAVPAGQAAVERGHAATAAAMDVAVMEEQGAVGGGGKGGGGM